MPGEDITLRFAAPFTKFGPTLSTQKFANQTGSAVRSEKAYNKALNSLAETSYRLVQA